MRIKIYITIIVFLALYISASGNRFSDSYLIGGNARFSNTNDWSPLHAALCDLLHQGGFNAASCVAVDSLNAQSITDMLSIVASDSLDAILEDFVLDPEANPGVYGARTLSGGNYYRFEAEYHDANTISQYDLDYPDSYFYMSSNADSARIGIATHQSDNENFSNQNFWKVNNGQVGYAYHDLTYKWPIDNSSTYYRVGQEFRFPREGLKVNDFSFFNENKLYITFAMQVEDIESLPDSTTLANIKFTCKGETTADTVSTVVRHFALGTNEVSISSITKEIYVNSPVIPFTSIHLINTYIIFPRLPVIPHGNGWDKVLVNINPTLFWYGHGTLKLDYVEFKDKLFKDYTDNDAVLAQMVANRTFGVPYLYGMDEPQPGQFQSFYRISRYKTAQKLNLRVFDIKGRNILLQPISDSDLKTGDMNLMLKSIKSGTYIVEITDNKKVKLITRKLTIK